jgi:transcriptional regulator with XRE-family HTH domain
LEKPWEKVGKKIRARRKELGFKTQADLAVAVGTDASRVSRWESGEEQPRGFRARLIEVLGVDRAFLDDVPDPASGPTIADAIEVLRLYESASPLRRAVVLAVLAHDVSHIEGLPDDLIPAVRSLAEGL